MAENFNGVGVRCSYYTIRDFLEYVFWVLGQYRITNVYVCDASISHTAGNVYLRFRTEECARNALERIKTVVYHGIPMEARFTTMDERGVCRFYRREGGCRRVGKCGFLHLVEIPRNLVRELQRRYGA